MSDVTPRPKAWTLRAPGAANCWAPRSGQSERPASQLGCSSSQAPPPNAPQWYRMTDAGHPYFWHAPTGATTWNEPGGSVWRECAAPELGGRQVFVWDGVAVQGG